MSREVTAQAAAELSRQLISPSGRYEVGQTMLEPFKEGRDYISIGRKIFAVHHLEPGAPAWYDIDAQFGATVIGSRGGAPRVLDGTKFDRVELTHFPITCLVRIGVEQPAIRRFDVLDREQVRAQAEMAETEDTEIFRAIRNGATAGSGIANGVTGPTNVTGVFSLANLALAYARLEDTADSNVENVLLRQKEYRFIRTLSGDTFDPVTRRELLKTGYMGDLWNAQIRVSKKLTSGEILLCASPEYLGVISVRIDLSQMDSPVPELLQYGWLLYEFIAAAQLTNVGSNLYTVTDA
jgi:hypothetical protein